MSEYLKAIQERVVIFDGAMGTNIQLRNPSVDDFRGKEGYNDILVLSRPDIIARHSLGVLRGRLRRG